MANLKYGIVCSGGFNFWISFILQLLIVIVNVLKFMLNKILTFINFRLLIEIAL